MADYTEGERSRLRNVLEAIDDLEGIAIPFNIIRQNIVPFSKWLREVLTEERDIDPEQKAEQAREEAAERRLQGLAQRSEEEEPERDYDGPDYEGPDEAKEWEDFEGPELPAEEE